VVADWEGVVEVGEESWAAAGTGVHTEDSLVALQEWGVAQVEEEDTVAVTAGGERVGTAKEVESRGGWTVAAVAAMQVESMGVAAMVVEQKEREAMPAALPVKVVGLEARVGLAGRVEARVVVVRVVAMRGAVARVG